MRRISQLLTALIITTLLSGAATVITMFPAQADTANVPSLVISQLKITSSNGQFITLYNPTMTTLDMSKYQLEYFNNYDLTKATSSKLIALSGTVPPHGYFVVNDDTLLLCYQLTVDSVSLDLSSTAGLVEVLSFSQTSAGGSVTPALQDYVGWSKTTANGAQTLPSANNAFLQRAPVDSQNNPAINSPGAGSWQVVQPSSLYACNLVSGSGSAPIATGLTRLLPPTEPPATIMSLTDASSTTNAPASLPPADIGLMAPEVTEILPNPADTGNDGTDEFIELYNPNTTTFDLNGFGLQAGTTALHNYNFPAGASLPAQTFVAFYSAVTGLSLSSSGGQVKLLDPFGNSISATDVYGTAADGQSWALAKGKWYWTTSPTPNAANIIKQPAAKKSSGSSKSKTAKSTSGAAKNAKTTATSASNASDSGAASLTPVHTWTLALVASLALLYGVYEYRADMANRFYRLRRYFRTRRADRA
jgi:hypothetical protein